MIPKTIENYGGPKIDAQPVSNPETQVAASEFNRAIEDTAQMTRTAYRAIVQWDTVPDPAPYSIPAPAIQVRTVWGNSTAQKPTIVKVATGSYTITFPSSFNDGLGFVETVSFFDAHVSVKIAGPGDQIYGRVTTVAGNLINVAIYSPIGTLADLADVSTDPISVTAWMV